MFQVRITLTAHFSITDAAFLLPSITFLGEVNFHTIPTTHFQSQISIYQRKGKVIQHSIHDTWYYSLCLLLTVHKYITFTPMYAQVQVQGWDANLCTPRNILMAKFFIDWHTEWDSIDEISELQCIKDATPEWYNLLYVLYRIPLKCIYLAITLPRSRLTLSARTSPVKVKSGCSSSTRPRYVYCLVYWREPFLRCKMT